MNDVVSKRLRIFAASPSDMASERAKVETVVTMLKPLADNLGVVVDVADWRAVVPNAGRAEQIILDQLKPDTWGVFLGILWHRFGTPTGKKNVQTRKEYLSGTEEEFHVAHHLWKQHGKPRIMMYRCTRPFPFDVDPDQLKRVNEFFKLIEDPESSYRVLTQRFNTAEDFETMLFDHLQKLLLEFGEAIRGKPISSEVVQVFAPSHIPDTLPRRMPFFGRREETAEAMRALSPEDRGWGVVIDGIGGIGKTALAIEIAHLCREQGEFDAFVFVSAKRDRLEPLGIQEQALTTTTLDAFINEISRAIGQPGIGQLTGEQKSLSLINALQDKKALLILDNLETLTSEDQNAIGDFLRRLPSDCKAIVTSRRRTGESAATIRLERLKWNDARELIINEMAHHPDARRVLSRVGESGWKQLYDEAGGSPLALTWTIGLIRARGFGFENALRLLKDGSTESDLNAFIYHKAQRRMNASERAALGALSFFGISASFEALSATTKLGRRALDVILERLRAQSLVDVIDGKDKEERYVLHPLTRRFARTDLVKNTKNERAMGMRFARYWANYAQSFGGDSDENITTYHLLEDEWGNIDAAASWLWKTTHLEDGSVADKVAARMLNRLARELWRFLYIGKRWDERLQLCARAYESACAIQNWELAGQHAFVIAFIYYNRRHLDEVKSWLDKCFDAFTQDGSNRTRSWLKLATKLYKKASEESEYLFEAE